MANTKISYLYRDASNYKIWNEAVVEGVLTEEQKQTIQLCLDGGEFFIPHLVDLPEKTFVDFGFAYSEQDDTPFFELSIEDIETVDEEPTEVLRADEMFSLFLNARDRWRELLALEAQ